MAVLSELEPNRVFYYFEEISKIPRGSDDTQKISDYCANFAKEQGLAYVQDEAGNVIIYKDASIGYEDAQTVILQGHMDMVCEKNMENEAKHDFHNDPLKLSIMDDYVYAKGTTLGADDGIAIAYFLAILESSEYQHPKLEVVLTVGEEIGMIGISKLDFTKLSGRRIINVDNETEGELLTSSAGGLRARCTVPVRFVEKTGSRYNIILCGLHGGHSGMDINKYRGNANILMGRLLHFIGKYISYDLIYLKGGLQDNAIPREAKAEILVKEKDSYQFEDLISQFEGILQTEYRGLEKNINVYCEDAGTDKVRVLTPKTKERVIFLLMTLPDGIQKMSFENDTLVQTSSNLGIMRLREDIFHLIISVRSSLSSEKYALTDKIRYLTETIGGSFVQDSDYSAWEYQPKSELRDIMFKTFQKCYGRNPMLNGIHAGLECGTIYKRIPQADIVSFGPQVEDIHTISERLSISSAKRTWEYLLAVLENLK
ncbi:MAG: aminoacyl-histidine dipeptidase [Clostridia bacterium]|nr:aminoacyl-histidine dipeptidase [Clostridia bacterium]